MISPDTVIIDLSRWNPCPVKKTTEVNRHCLHESIKCPSSQIFKAIHDFYNQQPNFPKQIKIKDILGQTQLEEIEKYFQANREGKKIGAQVNFFSWISYIVRHLPKQDDEALETVRLNVFERHDEVKGMLYPADSDCESQEEQEEKKIENIQDLPTGFDPQWLVTYKNHCQNLVLRGVLALLFPTQDVKIGVKRFTELSDIRVAKSESDIDPKFNWALFNDENDSFNHVEIQIWTDKNRKKSCEAYETPRETYKVTDPDDVMVLRKLKERSNGGFLLETTNGNRVTHFAPALNTYCLLIHRLRKAAELSLFDLDKSHFTPRCLRHTINGALGRRLMQIGDKKEREEKCQLAYERTGHNWKTMLGVYLTKSETPKRDAKRKLSFSTPVEDTATSSELTEDLERENKRQNTGTPMDNVVDTSSGVVVIGDTIHVFDSGLYKLVLH